MSDTPRCEALVDNPFAENCNWIDVQASIKLACQLERELAAAQAELRIAIEQRRCECSHEDACRFARERDAVQAENARQKKLISKMYEAMIDTMPECPQEEECSCPRCYWANKVGGAQ